MSYMNREDRRENVMEAAMRVALSEGLAAMTVRRIASEAGIAAGQVHHHFASSMALKAETFLRLSRQSLDLESAPPLTSWRAKLNWTLGFDNPDIEQYLRLFGEAEALARREAEMKQAWIISMEMWHDATTEIISQGASENEFQLRDSPENIAWRIIAFVSGLDGIVKLGLSGMDESAFRRHVDIMINNELIAPS
ncbi:TetR family transcriptional regulator [Atlantibacter hermannii]|uniref:TetR family transcriptional regulator n=1 Tax=Atlantibacter hermannii TaxID=565 RepID=UPI001931EEB7|nr:TetR family transcriptional regulator [Atlantibacter hermannii]MBL7637438.1 TetR family transcriptional regulator [Atlantibacter hermannii]MBL7673939.1 TetR family transcriptional regulator [Atlantibacter hermannii]